MEPKRLRIETYKPAGKPFGGGCDHREIELRLGGLLVRLLADEAYNLEAKLLRFLGLAVMLADQRLEALRQADEPHGQRAVLEHFARLRRPGRACSESIQTPCPIRKG